MMDASKRCRRIRVGVAKSAKNEGDMNSRPYFLRRKAIEDIVNTFKVYVPSSLKIPLNAQNLLPQKSSFKVYITSGISIHQWSYGREPKQMSCVTLLMLRTFARQR
jgi:hypothetical protein